MGFLGALSIDQMTNQIMEENNMDAILWVDPIVPLSVYDDAPESRGFFPVEDDNSQFGMLPPGDPKLGYCPECGTSDYYKVPIKAGYEIIDWFVACSDPECKEY